MKEQSELTTIILAVLVILPSVTATVFAYLSLRVGKKNEAAIAEVKTDQAKIASLLK